MSTRQQVLVLALLVTVFLPLGLAGVAGGFGPVEVGVWLVLVVALVVAIFTWGRGPRASPPR